MQKYHAVVIEQSLKNPGVLKDFKIVETKHSRHWDLHILEFYDIDEAIAKIQPAMVTDEPYYWHIYDDGKTLVVVFQDKVFRIDPQDKKTLKEAQKYGGEKLKIIAEQLDFYPGKFSDEPDWLAGKN